MFNPIQYVPPNQQGQQNPAPQQTGQSVQLQLQQQQQQQQSADLAAKRSRKRKLPKGAEQGDFQDDIVETTTTQSTAGTTGNPGFPVSRVKKMLKEDKDIQMITNDAVQVITFAGERFLELLASSAYEYTSHELRKIVTYKDVATAIKSREELLFLEDTVPHTKSFGAAVAERKRIQEGS
ncbi:histone-fold-containing protein [Cladochytrium replicatum]|nr:histone-fold-containing protein [Cladochytrium replicatum]